MATCYPLSAGNWLQNEWPRMTLSSYLTSKSVFCQHSVAALMRLLEHTAQIWMKIDPYYQRQKTSEIRQAILYDDMLPLVDRQMNAKWMTLSGHFMTKCIFRQHFLNQSVWMSEIVQPRRFCGVLWISRSTYTYTATAEKQRVSDALFLCGSAVAELLVFSCGCKFAYSILFVISAVEWKMLRNIVPWWMNPEVNTDVAVASGKVTGMVHVTDAILNRLKGVK